ncbi:hypothetical protein [Brevibacillus laterosporus]|uniref:hypothetical protein n=1 Tax=Brevibacillus laterosporus TaxID=1465 RepID=UPI0018CDE7AF|nr:hypothetical protein [Brevibacillus laterosporus]MBG9789638.1 hypothetical protein [Brevibacillus laterosporus]
MDNRLFSIRGKLRIKFIGLMLQEKIPTTGVIPDSVARDWVKIITICYIGNGLGYREDVDEAAETYYKKFIDGFKDREIALLLSMMDDHEMLYDTDRSTPKKRFIGLCSYLQSKTDNILLKKPLQFITKFPAGLEKVHKTTEFASLMSKIKV